MTRRLIGVTASQMPCARCGRVLDENTTTRVEHLQPEQAQAAGPLGPRELPYRGPAVRVGLCPTCAARADRAAQEAARPEMAMLAAQCGGTLARRLADGLDALAAVATGKSEHPALRTRRHLSPAEADLLIRHPATGLASLIAPTVRVANPTGCAALAPWSHLNEEERGLARDLAARLMAVKVALGAPPVPLEPPPGGPRACLLCGVGHQDMPALRVARVGHEQAAHEVWTHVTVPARNLARPAYEPPVRGWLCTACATAREWAGGSTGREAAERSLLAYLQAPDRSPERAQLDGLSPWAGKDGRPVNALPWEHLGDLSDLRHDLGMDQQQTSQPDGGSGVQWVNTHDAVLMD